jgi:DNA-binding winged helix-turn-helix (wHTH) protein/TolB-like protein/tetratricopeptide (TPR) repeat protein
VESSQTAKEVLRFGIFELDSASGELRRNGSVVRLQPQPFHVLQLLVRNAGDVVDRNRIRQEIWGGATVDFDRSLNVCIAQIRSALNDDAENPRFIQTLPRRGYRFLADVEPIGPEPAPPVAAPPPSARLKLPRIFLWTAASLVLIAGAATAYRIASRPEPPVRIAVLPFDAVGMDPADIQAEGIFDGLLTSLAAVQSDLLTVIGRRSVLRFRGETRGLREIGERLDAPYAIEGTVRKEAAGLRVAMRLARTSGDTLLWSETFDQNGGPADFEDQVVARVSAAVLQKLFPGKAATAPEPGCREGWEPYRTGQMLAGRGTRTAMEKSLPFFSQSNCTAARAALAATLVRLARISPRRADYWQQSRQAASGVDSSEAHRALGNIAFWHDWDWKAAEREFQAAIRRNPSDPDAHHDLAWLFAALGRRAEAVAALDRAVALDPLSAKAHMDSGWILLQSGRFERAAAEARRALELEPETAEAYACIARALLYAGDETGALQAFLPLLSADERQTIAAISPRDALRRVFSVRPAMDAYQRAWRLAWAGSNQDAIAALEEAFRTHSFMMPFVASDPSFTALHPDPRFQKLVRDLHL